MKEREHTQGTIKFADPGFTDIALSRAIEQEVLNLLDDGSSPVKSGSSDPA